ncbi:amino acid ABC transporter substrate-binding protein [Pseudomaricurvus alkylphenolicus]|jgi:polar amino acid transport system substrate-binding protein|uniref:substrate-binding periplasmic protein n=1 Tax=Pseudomaricurvus alkylphenolicus TaxID=1306991 RepID=UPI00142274EF|nr:transporter substrate-binding domain-containing protein [Pseudomaricurvus alkylphenolicus]NIB42337.1 amino acid ABC transporter substrate-binding protein [Pseudomaricurvus alkylphenolicus]
MSSPRSGNTKVIQELSDSTKPGIKDSFCVACTKLGYLLFALLAFSGPQYEVNAAPGNRSSILFATSNFPPWIYEEDGEIKGAVHEIVSGAANEIDLGVTTVFYPLKRLMGVLAKGEADAIILMSVSQLPEPQYPESVTRGREILFDMEISAASLSERNIRIDSISDFRKHKIGYLRLSRKMLVGYDSFPQKFTFTNASALQKALYANRIDISVLALPTLMYSAKQIGIENEIDIVYTFENRTSLRMGWHRNSDLAKRFDNALRKIKANRDVERILSSHMNIEFFGGYQ